MEENTAYKIRDLLAKNQSVAIAVGKHHTMDDMGAALALYLALTESGKQVSIASPTDPLVEVSSLVGIDKVRTSFDGQGGDLIVSFPYDEKNEEIRKVSYTIENGFLNIVVKAGDAGLSFSDRDVKYRRGGNAPTVLFVIGAPRIADLGTLFDPNALKDTTVVNIDNKSQNQGFGDVVLVSPDFSSVSEQVANLLLALEFPIEVDTAHNILAGIAFATDNFQKPRTSYMAFEIAAMMMKKGAKRVKEMPQRSLDTQPTQDAVGLDDLSSPFFNQPMPQQQRPKFQQQQQRPQQPQQQDHRPQQQDEQQRKQTKTPPPDWLMPKVYKGSTNV